MQSLTCIHHLSYEIVCCHLSECLSPMLAELRWNLSLCDTLPHKECQQTYVKSQVSSRRKLYLCTRHASIDVGISLSSLAHNDPPRIDVYCKWDSWIHQPHKECHGLGICLRSIKVGMHGKCSISVSHWRCKQVIRKWFQRFSLFIYTQYLGLHCPFFMCIFCTFM